MSVPSVNDDNQFLLLPLEVKGQIFSCLGPEDLLATSQACKALQVFVNDYSLPRYLKGNSCTEVSHLKRKFLKEKENNTDDVQIIIDTKKILIERRFRYVKSVGRALRRFKLLENYKSYVDDQSLQQQSESEKAFKKIKREHAYQQILNYDKLFFQEELEILKKNLPKDVIVAQNKLIEIVADHVKNNSTKVQEYREKNNKNLLEEIKKTAFANDSFAIGLYIKPCEPCDPSDSSNALTFMEDLYSVTMQEVINKVNEQITVQIN